jgi:hypothetical protein
MIMKDIMLGRTQMRERRNTHKILVKKSLKQPLCQDQERDEG